MAQDDTGARLFGVDKDPFALIATERRALADLVDGLDEQQLATPSLCGAWTVKDVAAHLMAAEEGAVTEFLVAWVRSGFSFDRANQRMTAARAGRPVSELTALMREHAESRFTPPTMDWHAPLTDVMIHREDIAVPLGLPSDRPVESWRHVLDFVVTPKARRGFGARPVARRTPGRDGRRVVARGRPRGDRTGGGAGPRHHRSADGAGGPERPRQGISGDLWPVEPRTVETQLKRG